MPPPANAYVCDNGSPAECVKSSLDHTATPIDGADAELLCSSCTASWNEMRAIASSRRWASESDALQKGRADQGGEEHGLALVPAVRQRPGAAADASAPPAESDHDCAGEPVQVSSHACVPTAVEPSASARHSGDGESCGVARNEPPAPHTQCAGVDGLVLS